MQTQRQPQPIDYANAVAAFVAKMSLERAVQVYDFVRFLQSQSIYPSPIPAPIPIEGEEDWLNDTEEQMQAEDALWTATQARHRDQFTALAIAARREIDTGTTQPLFAVDGELALP
jgi:hypothetical protein